MPKGSKKRKAIKRKEAANHHQSSTNSSSTHQENGAGGDHDSSDHLLTDDDFSPRSAMEALPEPNSGPVPEPVLIVSKEASIVPHPAVGKVVSVDPDPKPEPEPADSKEILIVPVEQQNVLEPEQIEAISAMTTEFFDDSSKPYYVEDEIGEGSLHCEQIEDSDHNVRCDAYQLSQNPEVLEHRASWWNCFELLGFFGEARR